MKQVCITHSEFMSFTKLQVQVCKSAFKIKKYTKLLIKSYVVGTHTKCLIETILMSTYNIGLGRELTDLEFNHHLLSEALSQPT